MTRYSAVLFDLDGTLLNTLPDLCDATNAMRMELGLSPLASDIVASYLGDGVDCLIKRALNQQLGQTPDAGKIQTGRKVFYQRYHLVNGDKAQIYPGVLEGLREFSGNNYKMAVVTNKSTEFALPLLERSGLSRFFEHIICGDTCANKKPHPEPLQHACKLLNTPPEATVLIGDSANDALAAKAANISVLLVPYGYSVNKNVHQMKVDAIVSDIQEAAKWVAQQKN
ncbi:MAG TPA: phosphoglycolate phosphatase [Burkholderiaceae bacterium]|nr:phosphoglycolate phosphatase [Burkholderiaceae bacterium]